MKKAHILVRPRDSSESEIPLVVCRAGPGAVQVADPGNGTETVVVDAVHFAQEGETSATTGEALWTALGPGLLSMVNRGKDVSLLVVGGGRTGKSRALWGREGLFERYAATVFEADSYVEIAANLVVDEISRDVLAPSSSEESWHVAETAPELRDLLRDALSCVAAFELHEDFFIHTAHLCVRCRVGEVGSTDYANCSSFVDLGSTMSPGDDGDDDLPLPERSLAALLKGSSTEKGALARLLAPEKIWLGCVAPTVLNVEETLSTLRTVAWLATVKVAAPILEATRRRGTPEGAPQGEEEPHILPTFSQLKDATAAYKKERRRWLREEASQKGTTGLCLVNLSADAQLTGRLRYSLDYSTVCFGSSDRQRSTLFARKQDGEKVLFVRVARPGLRPAHCAVVSSGPGALLKVERDAIVHKNGELLSGDTRLVAGDVVVLARCLAFAVEEAGNDVGQKHAGAMKAVFAREIGDLWKSQERPLSAWQVAHAEGAFVTLSSHVQEANAIADEVGKDVAFRVHVVNDDDAASTAATTLAVVSSPQEPVAESWPPRLMASRLARMRGLRRFFSEESGGDPKAPLEESMTDCFFCDPGATTHQLIGVAHCHLNPLSYLMPLEDSFDVVSYTGEIAGKVTLRAEISRDDIAPRDDYEEGNISKMQGERCRVRFYVSRAVGLPRKHCSAVYAETTFFDENPLTTPRCPRDTVNPTFDSSFSMSQIVTDDFVAYLANSALEVQIWGRRPTTTRVVLKS